MSGPYTFKAGTRHALRKLVSRAERVRAKITLVKELAKREDKWGEHDFNCRADYLDTLNAWNLKDYTPTPIEEEGDDEEEEGDNPCPFFDVGATAEAADRRLRNKQFAARNQDEY